MKKIQDQLATCFVLLRPYLVLFDWDSCSNVQAFPLALLQTQPALELQEIEG
jgi:hypothetical protein